MFRSNLGATSHRSVSMLYIHVHTGERTSGGLLAYVQYKQSLLRLSVRRNLIGEVRVHIHSKVPSDRLWRFNEREPPLVAGNRQNEEVCRLRGVNLGWDTGEDHGSERKLGGSHQQISSLEIAITACYDQGKSKLKLRTRLLFVEVV